ncbi:MAG: hypothetical protein F4Y85_11035 [Gammaproteobacteria bacterium]|nr:hypothetical protein [Gammaproteobacteria bacterium]
MAYADPDRRRASDRERYHRRTEERRAAGLCIRCGKREPIPGRSNCPTCAELNRKRERARNGRLKAEGRPRRDRVKSRETEKKRYRRTADERIARGLCPRCGKRSPEPDRALCAPCGDKVRTMARARYHKGRAAGLKYGGRRMESRRRSARIRSERRRQAWLDAGLCTRCGQNPPAEDGTTCISCRSRRQGIERKRYHDRKAAGLCVRCGEASTFDGAALCLSCTALEAESGRQERKNAASRRRYGERRQAGVCTDCRMPSHGASRCPECAQKSYERSSHFRGIPSWDPEFIVVDLETGEEHGPFDSRPDADACAAFLKLPPGGFEVVAENHPLAGSVGWS